MLPYLLYFSSLYLLLSYHTMSSSCLISIAVYLLAPACLCPRHDFQYIFMTGVYQYTCAYLCSPLGIHITTRRGVLTPLDPHVQVPKFGACEFSQLLIRVAQRKRGSLANRLNPYSFSLPARLSSFPSVNS